MPTPNAILFLSSLSSLQSKILNQVFETLMFFSEHMTSDLEVRKKALSGLGFLCTRHHELLCGTELCKFYHELLQTAAPTSTSASDSIEVANMELKSLVLENLLSFFLEEERRMLEQDAKCEFLRVFLSKTTP